MATESTTPTGAFRNSQVLIQAFPVPKRPPVDVPLAFG